MKKWVVFLLTILAVLAFSVAVQAEGNNHEITLTPQFDPEDPVLLWDSVCFEIRSNQVREDTLLFFYDDQPGVFPQYVWLDENGYGEAWFTPGTKDVDIYRYEEKYNTGNPGYQYNAYVQDWRDENVLSNSVTFSTQMLPDEAPAFTPTVTNVSGSSIPQDDSFRATVSNEDGFDIMCVVAFDGDGRFVTDSHWSTIDHDAETTDFEIPLLKFGVNKTYTAKVYALKFGYPMVYAGQEWTFRVISSADQGPDTDILIGGLKKSYITGEDITATAYYANGEELADILMEVSIFRAEYEQFLDYDDNAWILRSEVWQDKDGSLFFYPEQDWQIAACWNAGDYKYRVTVWQEDGENGGRVRVDGTERTFTVTSEGNLEFDPGLPEYIDAADLSFDLPAIAVPGADYTYVRIEDWSDHDWEADPDWNTLIDAYFVDEQGEARTVPITEDVRQRFHVWIEAGKKGLEGYCYETVIPIVHSGSRVRIWTEEELTDGALPINTFIPLWVKADEGAEWVRLENNNGEFDFRDNPDELKGIIEAGNGLGWEGANFFIATASYYDEEEGTRTEEQAILVLQGYADGDAGAFTATLGKSEVVRGETVEVTFTNSENAEHYWLDLDVWNEERNEWDWYAHLADLDGFEGGSATALMNTIQLEPNTYRVRALAEGPGYRCYEYTVTDSFTVSEAVVPESGMLVSVSAENNQVETCEEFELSAYAPGASWMEVIWDSERDNQDWRDDSRGRDSWAWTCAYGYAGEYRILVRAWFDVVDDYGNPVWVIDEGTGLPREGDQERNCIEEVVTVSAVQTKGGLVLAVPEGIPDRLAPSEQEVNIAFTVAMPEGAEHLRAEAWLEGVEDGGIPWQESRHGDLEVSFSLASLEIGQSLAIKLYAEGRGYEADELFFSIPVLPEENSDLAVITVDPETVTEDENGLYHAPIHSDVRLWVSAKEGNHLAGVRFFGANGWWENGEEINRENHGDWFDEEGKVCFNDGIHDESRIGSDIQMFAMVRLENDDTWYVSEPFLIHVDGYAVGPFDFESREPVSVPFGENATFTFTQSEGANQYWADAWNAEDPYGESYGVETTWSGTTVTLNTAQLHEGEFIIRGRAGIQHHPGMRESEGEVRLIVTPSEVPDGEVILTVDREAALTMEDIYASVFAPGADWVDIIRRNEDGEEYSFAGGGNGAAGRFCEQNSQTVQVFARAHYLERDEDGRPIVDGLNEDDEEIYRELDPKESETVKVVITAPNGKIAQDSSLIPASAPAGEALELKMPRDPNAAYLGWEIFTDRNFDDDSQEPDYRGDNALNVTIPADEVILGNVIELRVWTGGVGYEHNHQNYSILVTDGHEDRITLHVSDNEVQVNEELTVTVSVSEDGVNTIQYFNGDGFWGYWDDEAIQDVYDLDLDENGQWILDGERFGSAGARTLYARAWIDEKWVMSDPVKVTVTGSGQVGMLDAALENETVTRGETAILRYEQPAAHSDEERYELRHDRIRDGDGEEFVPYSLGWQRNTADHSFSIATAGLPAGEYRLSVDVPGNLGYEGRESRTIILTVIEPEGNEIRFEVDNPNVLTFEDVHVSVYAPGASRVEICWDQNNDCWDQNGESFMTRYQYGTAGTYQVYARAYYVEEGQEETSAVSEPVTVTVTSNGQQIIPDLSGLPAVLIAGEEAELHIDMPEDAGHMGWQIFWNEPQDWSGNPEPDIQGDGELKVDVPDNLQEGDTVFLKVGVEAAGYDHFYQDIRIPVITTPIDSISISFDKDSILTHQSVKVTVAFLAGKYDRIQLYDGHNYWDEENLDTDSIEKVFDDIGSFENQGTYTLYARLKLKNRTSWVFTGQKMLTVTAPNGPLEFDTSTVPARIYEGNEAASFTLTMPENAEDWNYRLFDNTEGLEEVTLIGWEGLKDGEITIPADKIIAGHRYRLEYNAFAEGYDAVFGGVDILAYEAPFATLSVDKKVVPYGENVTFTVNAPGSGAMTVRKLDGEGAFDELNGLTWTADQLGPVRFTAEVAFEGFGSVISNSVTVNVRSLGTAPAPAVAAPETLNEGEDLVVTVTPAEGGWAAVSIFDSGAEPVAGQDNIESEQTVTAESVHAGAYQVYIDYGKNGYDSSQIAVEIEAQHVYGEPEWDWEADFSGAEAVFTCTGTDQDEQRIEAGISSEVTKEPNCNQTGTEVFTATVTFQDKEYKNTRDKTLPKNDDHAWGQPVFTWEPANEGYTATATFTCGNNNEHTRTENAEVNETYHSEMTCTEPETWVYEAVCEGFRERKTVTGGEPNGHEGEWRIVWNDDYTASAERECDVCHETETAEAEVTSAVTREATCTVKGEITYTATVTVGGQVLTATRKQYTPRTEHTPGDVDITDQGLEVRECTVCHEILACRYPHEEHVWEYTCEWSDDDDNTLTMTRTCNATAGHPHSETETAKAALDPDSIVYPTETKAGSVKASAAFESEAFKGRKATITIPKLSAMSTVKLPASLTAIADDAFAGLACQAVIAGNQCESVGERAFKDCGELLYVRIPAGAGEIPDSAFIGCRWYLIVDRR